MNPETLQLLQSADDGDPVNGETPPGFNWHKAMNRVRSLKPVVEAIAGRGLEIDEGVQDASFYTQLVAYVQGKKSGDIETAVAVIFSAFGDLFTVWSSASGEVSEPVLQEVVTALQSHSFRYVDSVSLSEMYSGNNPLFQDGTWFDRFFSYL